jgi:hypothetical protein
MVLVKLMQIPPDSYDVVTTVRTISKGNRILQAHPDLPREKLSYVIVEDIARPGAFDCVGTQCSSDGDRQP